MDTLPDSEHTELEDGNSAETPESRSRIARGLDVTKSVLKTTRHITTAAFPATERVVGKAFDATGKVVQYGGSGSSPPAPSSSQFTTLCAVYFETAVSALCTRSANATQE
ncbi:hypothetical protein CYMTET_37772 [Cymbomonas tetramitiformis]|uniref:Uncharacterized protein n=1 Tax=Cymbomonas tetramitiformis TaxID=36881 RepID=A0AAE0F796_9CHLO|nr:hypothetical protein CYMTET_37772 [Cymbomonas tetramitiformis]